MDRTNVWAMTPSRYRYYHDSRFSLYNFGPDHPFAPVRQDLTFDLLQHASLIDPASIVTSTDVDESILHLFHTDDYIKAVKDASAGRYIPSPGKYGLGTGDNPIFPDMHEAALVRVAATLDATHSVMRGDAVHAANFSGGLHHAHPSQASGFCVYNDAAIAIAWLRKNFDCKVAYVDIDAHHGDGVQWGFYNDPDVLTVSIHQSGATLFPGTGFVDEIGEGAAKGTSVNIPLVPSTGADSWLECFGEVVPDVLAAFQPDVIVTQHGCDAHRLDPLSQLCVSVESLSKAASTLHTLAHELCKGRWIALGGGGYAIWQVVPRAWALTWAIITDQMPTGKLPESWRQSWQSQAPQGLEFPERWFDDLDHEPIRDWADFDAEWRREENLKTAQKAKEMALSHLNRRRT